MNTLKTSVKPQTPDFYHRKVNNKQKIIFNYFIQYYLHVFIVFISFIDVISSQQKRNVNYIQSSTYEILVFFWQKTSRNSDMCFKLLLVCFKTFAVIITENKILFIVVYKFVLKNTQNIVWVQTNAYIYFFLNKALKCTVV